MLRYTILFAVLLAACRPETDPSPSPAKRKAYVAVLAGLVLRDRPARVGAALVLIPFRTELEIQETEVKETVNGTSGKWVEASYQSQKGYVFGGYLTAEPFHPEVDRRPNADGTGLFILEYAGGDVGGPVCRNSYGGDPGCKIRLFADGVLVHSVQGFDPQGWVDKARFGYGNRQGEHGWSTSQYYEFSIVEKAVVHSYTTTSSEAGTTSLPPLPPSERAASIEFSICNRKTCTSVTLKDHRAFVDENGMFSLQRYETGYELREKPDDQMAIELDGRCWRIINRRTSAVTNCEADTRATSPNSM